VEKGARCLLHRYDKRGPDNHTYDRAVRPGYSHSDTVLAQPLGAHQTSLQGVGGYDRRRSCLDIPHSGEAMSLSTWRTASFQRGRSNRFLSLLLPRVVPTVMITKRTIEKELGIPVLVLEGDCYDTRNYSAGQLRTRVETLRSCFERPKPQDAIREMTRVITAGVDVGQPLPNSHCGRWQDSVLCYYTTGDSVARAAEKVTRAALEQAGLSKTDLSFVISTGYVGTASPSPQSGNRDHLPRQRVNFLIPAARTVIDIGGQDSKVIGVLKMAQSEILS